jgi:hypothetical protein
MNSPAMAPENQARIPSRVTDLSSVEIRKRPPIRRATPTQRRVPKALRTYHSARQAQGWRWRTRITLLMGSAPQLMRSDYAPVGIQVMRAHASHGSHASAMH